MNRRPAPAARNIARRLQQEQRREQLAQLRIQRALTDAERAEDDRLTRNLAMQVWRQAQRDQEDKFAQIAAAAQPSQNQEFCA